LAGLLLPAVQSARESARQMQCKSRLKNIGLAMQNYHESHGTFPPAWMLDSNNLNLGVWGCRILPYLEQRNIYNEYDSRVPPINEAGALGFPQAVADQNIATISKFIPVFICPSIGHRSDKTYQASVPTGIPGAPPTISWTAAPSDFCVASGVRGYYAQIAYANFPGGAGGKREGAIQPVAGVFGTDTSESSAIRDGLSNTIMIGERTGGRWVYRKRMEDENYTSFFGPSNGGGWGDFLNGEHWLQGELQDGGPWPPTGLGGPCAINCTNLRGGGFHSFHPAGCHFAMCDGAVVLVNSSVEPFVLAGMITRRKKEVFDEVY
jgi:hypothetical protein